MKWMESGKQASRKLAVLAAVHGPARTAGKKSAQGIATLALLSVVVLMPVVAHAAGQPWETTAEKTYDLIMSIARWVAAIAVVGCGLAAVFGKLSWDWAGKIVIGLVLIFGGTYLVDYFQSGM